MAPREPARLSSLEDHRAASRPRRACTRPPPPPPPAGRNPRRRDRAAPRAAEARAPRTRRWGRASGRSDACAALFSRCARIDGGEDDALQQVTETHERRGYEGDAHDDREVAILRRLPGHAPHAGPVEHLLDDHRTAEQERDLGAHDLGDRDQETLLERMAPYRGSLGARGADV